ncbi:MAG: 4Fe-4S binding protein [Candidatus Helarchaeota archaeon]|nr:4Fe-4S binding protein [Candidatus Helarchaeota archaeon]
MPSEEVTDPYERILQNMREYPNDIPMVEGKISETFREYIKLMFTPEEAEIAQHLEVSPLTIREISKRIGKDRKETKKILEEMAEKGVIQDIGGYSYFVAMAHLLNIGFKYSKALERLGKKGAELYLQFFIKEKFYKRYESSDAGTPITRVVPVNASIDSQSAILNAEEMHGIIDACQKPIVITDCPCRNRMEILGIRECKDKYPIHESCFQVGFFGGYFKRRGEGRELSVEEAHELVDKYAKLGLIFTTENVKSPNHQVICCCCDCCCSLLRGMTRFEDKNENCTSKSNYISKVAQDLCKGCGTCQNRCVFHAITIEDEKASVDAHKCFGCGACAVTCPTGAIKLHRVERSHIYEHQLELMKKIYEENR